MASCLRELTARHEHRTPRAATQARKTLRWFAFLPKSSPLFLTMALRWSPVRPVVVIIRIPAGGSSEAHRSGAYQIPPALASDFMAFEQRLE